MAGDGDRRNLGFVAGRFILPLVSYLALTGVLLAAPAVSALLTPTFVLYPESALNNPFPTVIVYPGQSASLNLTLASVNNFAGTVSMSVAEVMGPQGVSLSLSPDTVMLNAGGSSRITLTATAQETAPFNGGILQVNATSGAITSWAKVFFSIREHMSLTYDNPVTLDAGSSSTTSVKLTTNGFSAQVNVTASSPLGITASMSRETFSVNETARLSLFNLTVKASSNIAPGRYNVTITALSYTIVTVTDASTGVVISRTPKAISTKTLTVPVNVSPETHPISTPPTILGLSLPLFYGVMGALLAATVSITVILVRKRSTPNTFTCLPAKNWN